MKLRSLSFVCAIAIAMPAVAQDPAMDGPPIGSRLGKRVERDTAKSEAEAALSAHEMAKCLINRRGPAVRSLLAASTEADEAKARKQIFASNDVQCWSMSEGNHLSEGRVFTFPRDVLRGMLAEHLLQKETSAVTQLTALPRQMVYERPWFGFTGRDPVIDEMATCVAEVDPVKARAILATTPYSNEERGAFGAVMPVMGPCLRIGAKLTANRQALRAAIAEALYQRTQPWAIPAAAVTGAAK